MIEVSFSYTKNEWIDGRRKYLLLSKTIKKSDIIALIIAAVVSIFSIIIYKFNTLNIILSIIVAVFTAMLLLLYVLQPIWIFRLTEKYHHPYKMKFSSENISFESQGISSVLSWDIYSSYIENDRYFYLLQGKPNYVLIPKRAFLSDKDELQFKKLLLNHFIK
ncbi:YcxB family protein [Lacrimispora sp.]|uniref:YcxB family protein n=1 Tax=Lacrimispora sp. TaxID=2719234 RepID=UPI0028A639E4|nr:YcxB family protein [Lacrimispora sp.]